MRKRILCCITVLSIVCFIQSISFAQSPPIFTNKYTKTIGKPDIFQDSFQACNANAIYKLVVENGEGGKDRLSSGSISLNGQEIVRENDFNQKTDKIEKTVTLQSENTLDIKLASGPGGFIKASIYCVSGCLGVKIISPENNSTINRSKTIIQGSLSNAYGEIGLTIQSSGASGQASVLAEAQGRTFAGISTLQQGQNTIIATATDACGYQAHDTIAINTESVQEPIRLTANQQSGIPNATGTFSTTLEADASLPNPVSSYSWDTDGDGTADQSGSDLSKITAAYQSPGLYFPKVTVTDKQNKAYTETTIINVLSKEQMDALLKGKWEGMKGFLVNGKIDSALKNFIGGQSSKYKAALVALKDQLPTIFLAEEYLRYLSSYENWIEYDNIVLEGGIAYSYPIIFIKDENGLWKIKQF